MCPFTEQNQVKHVSFWSGGEGKGLFAFNCAGQALTFETIAKMLFKCLFRALAGYPEKLVELKDANAS